MHVFVFNRNTVIQSKYLSAWYPRERYGDVDAAKTNVGYFVMTLMGWGGDTQDEVNFLT